jgi:hypothetical protein
MAERVLIDTDVLVDAARGVEEAVAYLAAMEEQRAMAMTVIVTKNERHYHFVPGLKLLRYPQASAT